MYCLECKERQESETDKGVGVCSEKMPPATILVVLFTVVVVVGGEGKSMMLTLERASHEGVGMSQLRNRDRVRHGRLLQQQPMGVVDFTVEGTYDPYLVGYIYLILLLY